MTEHSEDEPALQPAPVRHGGWWDNIIAAVLQEYEEPEEERMERGLGR